MSDAEFYRIWDEQVRLRKRERLAIALEDTETPWTKHTEHHWSIRFAGKLLNYWPSTGKWQWEIKTYQGTHADLLGFMKKRGYASDG